MPDARSNHPRSTGTLAELDLTTCAACGSVAEVGGSFEMPGLGGPERYVRTRCMLGHIFVGPEFALRQG